MRPIRYYFLSGLLALALTIILTLLVGLVPSVALIDSKGRDMFFRISHQFSEKPAEADQITLVTLDDESLEQLQKRWPYPRSIYGKALHRMIPHNPKVVGFDLIFSGDDWSKESDLAFAEALKEAGNVVVAHYYTKDGEVGPLPLIRESSWEVGRVDKIRDKDFVIRRHRMTRRVNGEDQHSWEYQLLKGAFPGADTSSFPMMQAAPINYYLTFDEFNQVPFWKLIKGVAKIKDIKNKVIMVGLTAAAFHDVHVTPLGSMAGVAINANILLMMMRNEFFEFVSPWIKLGLTFLSLWFALLVAMSSTVFVGITMMLAMSFLYFWVSYILFKTNLILDPWILIMGVVCVYFGAIAFRQTQLIFENFRLQEESSRDALTGFYNRRFLTLKLKAEFHRLIGKQGFFKSSEEISVVMIDLDNFKLVNDSFGHAEGDRVLKTMAETIRSSVRKHELICRFGGDEFCVILPGQSIEQAAKFADKVCNVIRNNSDLSYTTRDGVKTIQVTGSMGVASVAASKAMEHGMLMKAADRALYRAKAGGRNQVCVFDPKRDVIE